MKKTFKERLISGFSKIANKHKALKYPCLVLLTIILGFYNLGRHFAMNGKRYASVAFVILFFMNSCSFSFGVFIERTGFVNAQETYSAIVEDSDISLAEQNEISLEEPTLLSDEDAEYDETEDLEGVDSFTLDDILENQDSYEAYTEEPEETDGEYVFDSSDWRLVLVNKQHPIPKSYDFTLGTIKGSMQCDERIINDLLAMLQAAKDDGVNLAICSPYRDMNKQEKLFSKKLKIYMNQGMSYMEAYKLASQAVTIPGASEHQIGLALDIFSDTYTSLDEGFADTEAGKWLAEHSCEYGFTLRYPEGKEYITSIEYEPWHFRYVGKEAAMTMKNEDICLEEFWDKYL
jgi:D-alanyl-D-alanine carboxypeptidase